MSGIVDLTTISDQAWHRILARSLREGAHWADLAADAITVPLRFQVQRQDESVGIDPGDLQIQLERWLRLQVHLREDWRDLARRVS